MYKCKRYVYTRRKTIDNTDHSGTLLKSYFVLSSYPESHTDEAILERTKSLVLLSQWRRRFQAVDWPPNDGVQVLSLGPRYHENPALRRLLLLLQLLEVLHVSRAHVHAARLAAPPRLQLQGLARTWVQISEKFKVKVENTAKVPKYSMLAF